MNTSSESERGAMTGSNIPCSSSNNNDNHNWIGDALPSHRHRDQRASTGSITSGRFTPPLESMIGVVGGVVPAGVSSLYRVGPTSAETAHRLFPLRSDSSSGGRSAHYAPYSAATTASCIPSYSSLYTGQHHNPIHNYTSLYPHLSYQAAAAAAAVVAGGIPLPGAVYPPLDSPQSYATILANIGSQQTQLPRSPFIAPQIPQLYGSPTNSPGPTQSLTPRVLQDRKDSKSPTRERQPSLPSPKQKRREHSPPVMLPHHPNFSHQLPNAIHPGVYPKSNQDANYIRDNAAANYRHFINRKRLSRPSDIVIHGSNKHDLHGDIPNKRHRSSPGLPLPPLWNTHRGERGLPPPPPLQSSQYPPQPHYPQHFMKGSIIQLANGELKRVEDLRTYDFVHSADVSGDLMIDSSTVVRIEESGEKASAILGFSVGEHRVQVCS